MMLLVEHRHFNATHLDMISLVFYATMPPFLLMVIMVLIFYGYWVE